MEKSDVIPKLWGISSPLTIRVSGARRRHEFTISASCVLFKGDALTDERSTDDGLNPGGDLQRVYYRLVSTRFKVSK